MNSLEAMVDTFLQVEKTRVRLQIRKSHLARNGREDKVTDEALERIHALEKWGDKVIGSLVQAHPAYPWFSKVKGVGRENIAKVVAQVRVKPETIVTEDGELVELPYADTVSALWSFAGYAVVNGHAPKRTKGEKLPYNGELRTMCWRLGTSLMKARGSFYGYYLKQKERYVQRYENAGTAVVPAAKLPKVDGKKQETDTAISEGHIHNLALRKTIKLFLSCLWIVWREAEGLPVREPYVLDQLGHTSRIDPWDMVDREEHD